MLSKDIFRRINKVVRVGAAAVTLATTAYFHNEGTVSVEAASGNASSRYSHVNKQTENQLEAVGVISPTVENKNVMFGGNIEIVYVDGTQYLLPQGKSVGMYYPPKGSVSPALYAAQWPKGSLLGTIDATTGMTNIVSLKINKKIVPVQYSQFNPETLEQSGFVIFSKTVDVVYNDGSEMLLPAGRVSGLKTSSASVGGTTLSVSFVKGGETFSLKGVKKLTIDGAEQKVTGKIFDLKVMKQK